MNALKEIRSNKPLLLTLAVGFLFRVLFILVGAKFYFGRENIYFDGDTDTWEACIQNLFETGVYTLNPSSEYGYFGRTPGYSFFMGIFYLLSGRDWNAAYPVIAWTQIILDVIAIYFVYKVGMKLFGANKKSALIPALLYATYPFIIVWNPVVYSESLSIFFLVLSFYFFISEEKKYNYFFAGVFVSLSALCRPQVLLIIPVLGIALLIKNRKNYIALLKTSFQFGLAVLLIYGSWPIRNYVNYHKIILTHDLRGFVIWTPDVLSFSQYIYSVKAEWEPQFSSIVFNKEVTFPKEAYTSMEDSLKLQRAIVLSKNCGSGFSEWLGYWKAPILGANCDEEIKSIFDELRAKQIKQNPVNFYLILPLKNLRKALFKFKLYNAKSFAKKAASWLFIYRTFLILLGLYGTFSLIKDKNYFHISLAILLYFILLYLALCAGTGPQFRNIEMRYFLPADILLLFTAAMPIAKLVGRRKISMS